MTMGVLPGIWLSSTSINLLVKKLKDWKVRIKKDIAGSYGIATGTGTRKGRKEELGERGKSEVDGRPSLTVLLGFWQAAPIRRHPKGRRRCG
jgi:hypothetical protein